jgi:hypothetical protein
MVAVVTVPSAEVDNKDVQIAAHTHFPGVKPYELTPFDEFRANLRTLVDAFLAPVPRLPGASSDGGNPRSGFLPQPMGSGLFMRR